MRIRPAAPFVCLAALLAACAARKPAPEEAQKWIDDVEQKLLALGVDAGRADWVKSTYITDDTEALSAKLDERAIGDRLLVISSLTPGERLLSFDCSWRDS